MDTTTFRFRQFEVSHTQSTMKVGTDAVLLGAVADVGRDHTILDVGTGCGIIALMLAQRQPQAFITAIDLDRNSAQEAASNFRLSPWSDRLTALEISMQAYADNGEDTFDHIVSNPPFFTGDKKSVYPSRTKSRHTVYLSHEAFVQASRKLSHKFSRLSVILPLSVSSHFIQLAEIEGFNPDRIIRVRPRQDLPVNRSIISFTRQQAFTKTEEFTLYGMDGNYSEAYHALTKEFHL